MRRVLAVFLSFVVCICSLSIPEKSMGVNAKSVCAETNETSSNSNEEIKDELETPTIIDEGGLTPFGATKVTITFNANGGSVSPGSKSVNKNSKIGSMPTPTRTGYSFQGWYTSSSGGSSVSSSTKATKSMTVYAHWKQNVMTRKYTVTFDANGGTVSPTSKTVDAGTTIAFPTPTREGYTFEGWYTSASGGTRMTSLKVTKNQTIYAQWSVNQYTITLDANGGKPPSPASIVADYGTTVALPTPSRQGHTFEGWYENSLKVQNIYYVTKSTTLVAHWKLIYCEVTFDPNGGTFTEGSYTTTALQYGNTIGGLPKVTRSGYYFLGWYTKEYGGEEITPSTPIYSNMTVYAHWSYIPSVTYAYLYFDANGGTVSTSSKAVEEGSTAGTLPTPTREDYTFLGWYTSESGGTEVTSSTRIDYSMTVYAHWQYSPPVRTCTLTFNANGGSVSSSFKTVTEGTVAGTLPTPTRDGYTFLGWFTDPTGGSEVTSSTIIGLSMTLYAHWSSNVVVATVTFDANGGTVSTTTKKVNCGDTIGSLPTPTRTGYTFLGWYTDATNGTKVTSTTVINETALTLYAHWSIVKCTVTFNANGGTVTPTSLSVNYNDTIGLLPTPTREGYAFKGWFTSASGGTEVTSSTKVTSNIVIYAQWTLGKCTVNFDANGGTVTPTSISVNYGSAIGTLPTPTRNGYTFLGWFTSASGGTEVTSTTVVKEMSLTLYAHWSYTTIKVEVPQTLIADKNGNSEFLVKTNIQEGKITINPPAGFYYKQSGKDDVYAKISTLESNVLTKSDNSIKYSIVCNGLSAGCWKGTFNITISISN